MPTGTSGFGFEIPAFRMNQGVNASTANPMARGGAMQQAEPVMESQFGLNLDVMARAEDAAKTQFYGGVNELNNFINTAAQFGIDPTKVDMSNPESFALNKQYRDMMNSLQQQAQAIRSGAIGQIAAQNKADEEWQKSQRDYDMNVLKPRREKEFQRQEIIQQRQDLEYSQGLLDERVKKAVRPFATQLNQFLSLHLNSIDQENNRAIQNERTKLLKALDGAIVENKENPEVAGVLDDFRDQVRSVSVLTKKGGDGGPTGAMSDLSAYKKGAFSKNPTYNGAKLYGFEVTPNGLKVYGKMEQVSFAGQNQNAEVPFEITNPREISNIIANGFGDSESDGKLVKIYLQRDVDEAMGGGQSNNKVIPGMMVPKKKK